MFRRPKTEIQRCTAFGVARRRALARLGKGLDLRWTPGPQMNYTELTEIAPRPDRTPIDDALIRPELSRNDDSRTCSPRATSVHFRAGRDRRGTGRRQRVDETS